MLQITGKSRHRLLSTSACGKYVLA